MTFARSLFPVLFVLSGAFAAVHPGASAAQQAGPEFETGPVQLRMMYVDPALFGALKTALTPAILRQLGYASFDDAAERAEVTVALADCAAACNEGLDRGMCLCKPGADGACPPGAGAATQSGDLLCKGLPATATIFASDGGLGTTRLRLAR